MESNFDTTERTRRQNLASNARKLISQTLEVKDVAGTPLQLQNSSFYLQVAFSELHPLVVLFLARSLNRQCGVKEMQLANELNLKSILGSHAVNVEAGCYSYRSIHWLDTELTKDRFLEILARSTEEAERAFAQLV
jgi:hypothetical protein